MSKKIVVIERPFTVEEMRQEEGRLTAVIAYPWDEAGISDSSIDALNDFASRELTGSECALEDIGYRLVGADVERQEILLEVSGTVHNWLAEQDGDYQEESEADPVADVPAPLD